MASAPALAQTPASSMNVAVNNFIPDSSGWRKPNADQGWSSWSHPAWEADGRDEWSWSGHAGHAKQLKDKWSNEKGKAKNWKADPEEWKPPKVAGASPLPVEKAPVEVSPVASFIIPCRSYFVGRCKFGCKCEQCPSERGTFGSFPFCIQETAAKIQAQVQKPLTSDSPSSPSSIRSATRGPPWLGSPA